VLFDLFDDGGPIKGLATIPEIIWELALSIYPLIRGSARRLRSSRRRAARLCILP
jgi:hypothetical protein